MKAIIVFVMACVLTSCSIASQCPSYGETNLATNHGKKAQSKYARHNKHRSLF